MSETWEQTKARLRKQGISTQISLESKPVKEKVEEPPIKRFNVHKRSLPVGLDKIVLFAVTKDEAQWWVEWKLKTKVFNDEVNETKTIIYFDIIPVDATPKERSIYFNTKPVITEEFKGTDIPRRVN